KFSGRRVSSETLGDIPNHKPAPTNASPAATYNACFHPMYAARIGARAGEIIPPILLPQFITPPAVPLRARQPSPSWPRKDPRQIELMPSLGRNDGGLRAVRSRAQYEKNRRKREAEHWDHTPSPSLTQGPRYESVGNETAQEE